MNPIGQLEGELTPRPRLPELSNRPKQSGGALKTIVGTENSVRLIYGGNVNLNNCREIASVNGIDGLFVGGAAVDPAGFVSVIGRALDGAPD